MLFWRETSLTAQPSRAAVFSPKTPWKLFSLQQSLKKPYNKCTGLVVSLPSQELCFQRGEACPPSNCRFQREAKQSIQLFSYGHQIRCAHWRRDSGTSTHTAKGVHRATHVSVTLSASSWATLPLLEEVWGSKIYDLQMVCLIHKML